MTWDYRIVQRLDGTYALHEVYYNPDGTAWARSELPATIVGETEVEVMAEIGRVAQANVELLFVEPETWAPRASDADAEEVGE